MAEELLFNVPGTVQIIFDSNVIDHFLVHRQDSPSAKEAGGQLFARIQHTEWHIVLATGPRKIDWRSRIGFRPDRKAEQDEIQRFFRRGLHYVGDWHTHPEMIPNPSSRDLQSMNDLVMRSIHELPGLLLVIVGIDKSESGLWVSVHMGSNRYVKAARARS